MTKLEGAAGLSRSNSYMNIQAFTGVRFIKNSSTTSRNLLLIILLSGLNHPSAPAPSLYQRPYPLVSRPA
eukprot:725289-Hanusia_phi.AAC.1